MTDKITRPPKDNLVRAVFPGPEVPFDEPDDDFDRHIWRAILAVWDQWTEIDSTWEGNFMERVRRSAFEKAVREDTPKVLFQHGQDPQDRRQAARPHPLSLAPDETACTTTSG